MTDGSTTPLTQAYRMYEQLEGQLSNALEQLVATNAFADLLAASATNVMAATRIANVTVDRMMRTTRLATHQDVVELARQLARTEEKLERLLQAVEELGDRLDGASAQSPAPDRATTVRDGRTRRTARATATRAARPRPDAGGPTPEEEAARQDTAADAVPEDTP